MENRRNSKLFQDIKQLLREKLFAVLCNQVDRESYGSLIAFVYTENLKYIF